MALTILESILLQRAGSEVLNTWYFPNCAFWSIGQIPHPGYATVKFRNEICKTQYKFRIFAILDETVQSRGGVLEDTF